MRRLCEFTICILLIAGVMTPEIALGKDDSARDFALQLTKQSQGIVGKGDARQAGDLFMRAFDLRTFVSRCLADHWNSFTETQRSEFIDLFARSLQGQMNRALEGRLRGRNVTFIADRSERDAQSDITRVPIIASVDGNALRIVYFLSKDRTGWRVVDYEVEGALLSRNYRGQFNYLLRTYGYAGMIDRMREKAVTLEKRT